MRAVRGLADIPARVRPAIHAAAARAPTPGPTRRAGGGGGRRGGRGAGPLGRGRPRGQGQGAAAGGARGARRGGRRRAGGEDAAGAVDGRRRRQRRSPVKVGVTAAAVAGPPYRQEWGARKMAASGSEDQEAYEHTAIACVDAAIARLTPSFKCSGTFLPYEVTTQRRCMSARAGPTLLRHLSLDF